MDCSRCNFSTKCHESLVSHVTKKHKMCLKCGQTFLLQEDLYTHLQYNHGEQVKCTKCSFKAYPAFELFYHAMTEHGICGKCEKTDAGSSHLDPNHQSRLLECTIWKRFRIDSTGESDEEPIVSIETLDYSDHEDAGIQQEEEEPAWQRSKAPVPTSTQLQIVTGKQASSAIDIKQELLEDHVSNTKQRSRAEVFFDTIQRGIAKDIERKAEAQRKRMVSEPERQIQRKRKTSDIENIIPRNLEPAVETQSLDCKYCNKYFTYTAPNRIALINHFKSLHLKELAGETPEIREMMLAELAMPPKNKPKGAKVLLPNYNNKPSNPIEKQPAVATVVPLLMVAPGRVENPVPEPPPSGSNSKKKDKLTCKLCTQWFTFTAPNKEALTEHYSTIHKNEISRKVMPVFKCIHCPKGKPFVHETAAGIKDHQKVHHSSVFIQDKFLQTAEIPTTLSCGLCEDLNNFTSSRREDIKDHLNRIHGEEDDEMMSTSSEDDE